MTVAEALAAREALRALGGHRMDTLAAVRVARLTRALQAALRPFEEVHDATIERLSGGGTRLTPEDDGWQEYATERARMLADDLGAEIEPVEIRASGIREVEPNVLLALDGLVEIVED